nr:type I-C CRISPR-associated protein Cas8c/Csd1 [Bifidobacterium breve]
MTVLILKKLIDANVQTYANYAKQFGKLLRGYGNEKVLQQMQQHSRRIVVTIFDAATSGRLSVTFYRELSQNEYIESVLQWHEDAAWYLTCFDNKNSASTDDEAPRGSKKSSDKLKPIPYIGARHSRILSTVCTALTITAVIVTDALPNM